MHRRSLELLVALVLAALCVAGLFEAASYRGQSRMMPLWVVGFALALSLIWAGQSILGLVRGDPERFELPRAELIRFAVIVGAVLLYVLAVDWLGFFSSTVVMVPALAAALGYRYWLVSLLATAGFVVVLYGVFRLLLAIPLPPEALLQGISG